MRTSLSAAAAALLTLHLLAGATAQVETVNTGTAIQPVGCASYFDLVVEQKLSLTSLDFQCSNPASTPGTANVFILPGGRSGKQTVPGDWILWAPAVPITSAGPLAWTSVPLPALPLNATGPFGIALVTNLNQVATAGGGTYPSVPAGESLIDTGEITVTPFAGQVLTNFTINVGLHYTILPVAFLPVSPFATAFPTGEGCYRTHASFYEVFTPAAAHDLAGANIMLTPNSCGGYDVSPSPRPYRVSTNQTPVIQSDEGTSAWILTPPMPLPGGATTSTLRVHANGVVSSGTSSVVGRDPSPAAWLAMPDTVWGDWHDYDATQPGGPVTIEIVIVGLETYWVFTWNGVVDHGTPSGANNFQIEFNQLNGQVHMHWGTMSLLGNNHLVGYSPGGPSTDPGSMDLSVTPSFSTCADHAPLTLSSAFRPVQFPNFSWINTLDVTEIPDPNPTLVVILFGLGGPPIDLGILGAPGCLLHLASLDPLFSMIGFNTVATQSWTVPAYNGTDWRGQRVDLQAIAFVPNVNLLGAVTSNGLALTFGEQ